LFIPVIATCNLRKSYGAHMVAQAGDPLPPVQGRYISIPHATHKI